MKTVVLSRAWGLSIQDAKRIAQSLSIRDVRFVSSRCAASAPTHVRRCEQRGAKFLVADRREEK
jgi:hypothetical protein